MVEATLQPIEPAPASLPSSAAAAQEPSPVASEAVPAAAPNGEAPAPEAAPALKPHTDEPSLLTQALKEIDDKAKPKEPDKPVEPAKADAKPEEKKPGEAEAKPAEAKPQEKPPLDPVEYKYTLPETLKMDDAMKAEVHTAFDAFRADPSNPQPLIDLHNKAMQTFVEQHQATQLQAQHDAFRKMRDEWGLEIAADPEVGGNGHQTTKAVMARMRDKLVPPEMLQTRTWPDGAPRPSQFQEFLETTGAGDNVVFWRILKSAARYADTPQASDQPTDIKPPKDIGRPPGSKRLYRQPAPRQQ